MLIPDHPARLCLVSCFELDLERTESPSVLIWNWSLRCAVGLFHTASCPYLLLTGGWGTVLPSWEGGGPSFVLQFLSNSFETEKKKPSNPSGSPSVCTFGRCSAEPGSCFSIPDLWLLCYCVRVTAVTSFAIRVVHQSIMKGSCKHRWRGKWTTCLTILWQRRWNTFESF